MQEKKWERVKKPSLSAIIRRIKFVILKNPVYPKDRTRDIKFPIKRVTACFKVNNSDNKKEFMIDYAFFRIRYYQKLSSNGLVFDYVTIPKGTSLSEKTNAKNERVYVYNDNGLLYFNIPPRNHSYAWRALNEENKERFSPDDQYYGDKDKILNNEACNKYRFKRKSVAKPYIEYAPKEKGRYKPLHDIEEKIKELVSLNKKIENKDNKVGCRDVKKCNYIKPCNEYCKDIIERNRLINKIIFSDNFYGQYKKFQNRMIEEVKARNNLYQSIDDEVSEYVYQLVHDLLCRYTKTHDKYDEPILSQEKYLRSLYLFYSPDKNINKEEGKDKDKKNEGIYKLEFMFWENLHRTSFFNENLAIEWEDIVNENDIELTDSYNNALDDSVIRHIPEQKVAELKQKYVKKIFTDSGIKANTKNILTVNQFIDSILYNEQYKKIRTFSKVVKAEEDLYGYIQKKHAEYMKEVKKELEKERKGLGKTSFYDVNIYNWTHGLYKNISKIYHNYKCIRFIVPSNYRNNYKKGNEIRELFADPFNEPEYIKYLASNSELEYNNLLEAEKEYIRYKISQLSRKLRELLIEKYYQCKDNEDIKKTSNSAFKKNQTRANNDFKEKLLIDYDLLKVYAADTLLLEIIERNKKQQ